MSADERPNLDPIADHEKLSRFQIVVIALCAGVMLLDGFDTQAIAFAAPGIAADWHISPTSFSFVFGIGLFGGLVGAICTGVIADRFGRKPTLVLAVILFGLASLSTPLADSKTSLSVIRFITGLGVGAPCRGPSRSPPSTPRSGCAPPSRR
ncbi:MAG: transporter, family, 4-hydroxybenzoate transporter [Streptomyces sp.]|jgi:AAHS family 4-hydroxybenzoate transporter-like MFS transporter|nr:transporter, family, 4-hydroxybenzoate transporter [Streptomyces sp.]